MTTYTLTVSTNALGFGVISGARVVAERKRTKVTDIFNGQSLSKNNAATNSLGVATMLLEPDDGTVYHEVKIFDLAGILIYTKIIIMPPQSVSITDLPIQDIISESAAQAVAAAATSTAQAVISTEQAVIATAQAVLTAADRVQTGLDAAATDSDRVQTGLDRVQTGLDRVQTGADAAAAESARDAALIQAGVYTTEALGRAAVADGQAFKVQGSGNVAAYEYRRTNSTTSVLIATYPSAASVSAVSDGFNFVPSRNLYDKTNAVDGMLMSYVTGLDVTYANGMSLGYFPVVAGKTYTLSMSDSVGFHSDHVLYCRNSSGDYLGIDHTVGATTGMASPPTSIVWTGNSKVTFTIPSGSTIAYVGTMTNYSVGHTTVDFNRVVGTVQAEEGTSVTVYQRYSLGGLVVPKDPQPESVFSTTAAGIAATTSGKYFSVISNVVGESDILYLNSSGVAVEQKRTPSLNSVGALTDAYTVVASRNLYDKSNAVNAMLMSYATGTNSSYANGMSLGYFPVTANKTYTVSMSDLLGFNSAHALYCRDVNGTFLGIDHTVGATTGMASPPTSITWTGNSKVTFTIPSGSAIAYVGLMTNYSVHVTDDFNRVIGTVQAEEGATATEYQRYAKYGFIVAKDADANALLPQAILPMSVTKSGNKLYIRAKFTSTLDIIQLVEMATGTAFTNDTVNVQGARTCDNTLSKLSNVAAWNTGTILANQGDSTAPIQYNGTYIGGNHGAYVVKEITATGHGKTVVDIGSEWTDSLPRKWYLMRIVDANKLWFVSENLSVAPAWSFSLTITGSTLNHSASATNTGAITVVSSVGTQLWPALQSQTKKIMLDGITELTVDGTYLCTTLDIVNSYTIPNVAAVLTYVRSLVGGATQPSFIDSSIAPDISRTITYRYAENGSCSIIDSVRNYNQLTLNFFGGTQAEPLEYTGKQLWQYIPRVSSIVGTIKTWDFINQENIGGTFEALTLGLSQFTDVNNPPDRMAQIVKTAGVSNFGMMIGFSPIRSVGLPATRKTLISESNFVSAIRKQYLRALNGGGSAFTGNVLPVNSMYDMVVYRAYWSAETCPDATAFIWFRDGKNIIVIADFHQSVSFSKLPLPEYFSGLDVTVIDKTASLTLHGNNVLNDGLLVTVTGGYGYIVAKLS